MRIVNHKFICSNCGFSEEITATASSCVICGREKLNELLVDLFFLENSLGPEYITRFDRAFIKQKVLERCPDCIRANI